MLNDRILTAPYGSWRSPITSDLVARSGIALQEVLVDGDDVYWIEGRPQEGGRCVVVRREPDGTFTDLTPAPYNVRTRAHEYGGGAALIAKGVLYFSNYADGVFHRQEGGNPPEALTQNPQARYADAILDAKRRRLICVREEHGKGGEPVNVLASLSLDGAKDEKILVDGADFYSSPRLSPDGRELAWLSWNHPNMPWMGTELWVGTFDAQGLVVKSRLLAGSESESIFQPEWSPDGILYFISDRSGWWNIHREKGGEVEVVLPMEAEFGRAQWVFGMSTYGWVSERQLICAYFQKGSAQLAVLDLETGSFKKIPSPYTEYSQVRVGDRHVFMLAGAPDKPTSLVRLDLATLSFDVLRSSSKTAQDSTLKAYFSTPRFIEFPSGPRTAFGWYYPPCNPDYRPLPGETPPLIVKSHGGPTSAATSTLSLRTQYWTSRGYAVLDVDYGGSAGYGRAYRDLLHKQWGLVDVEDCQNGLKHLVESGLVDGNRAMITGGSAGGYTTLCALTFKDSFCAGASHYGVSDLAALARDTHKFESHYLEWLIGKYPEEEELYRARSPIYFTERLSVPVIFFQGEDDKVVPPGQSSLMVEAIRRKGLPVGYLLFQGEAHGFRKAENIKRSLDAELYFYASLIVRTGLRC
jgi:dipeptidyl aminopeptidase/acylaminoacyl peptidase